MTNEYLPKPENINRKKAFINGKIFTADNSGFTADGVLISGNKIIYAGSGKDITKLIDSNTEIIDLKGKLMLPGFIDAHTHFIDGGFYLLGLDLRPAESVEDFITILKTYAAQNKRGWITGGNWNQENWIVPELPSKELIDPFTENIPVFIERLDKHMGLANSAALKLAGITKDTLSPKDGTIVKDAVTGEPTGIIKDNAMKLIYSVIPKRGEKELSSAASAALDEAKRNGVTGIHDISLPEHFAVFQDLLKENKLTCRIFSRLPIKEHANFTLLGIQAGFGNEMLRTGSLKAFADGSLGAGTAWFFEPYIDGKGNYGLPMDELTSGRMETRCLESDLKKLQISVHAIGDRANSSVLDIFEKVINTNPEWNRRFRIEHAQHIRDADVKRFSVCSVIASMQPYHLIDDSLYAGKKIGKDRIAEAYVFRKLLNENVKLCFGSDWPVAPLKPLTGIYAAVTGGVSRNYPDGFNPGQKITVEEAVRCYTINSAYASYEENLKGSIEPGKLADFVVLNGDIFSVRPERIKDIKVEMTVLDGEIIYRNNS